MNLRAYLKETIVISPQCWHRTVHLTTNQDVTLCWLQKARSEVLYPTLVFLRLCIQIFPVRFQTIPPRLVQLVHNVEEVIILFSNDIFISVIQFHTQNILNIIFYIFQKVCFNTPTWTHGSRFPTYPSLVTLRYTSVPPSKLPITRMKQYMVENTVSKCSSMIRRT